MAREALYVEITEMAINSDAWCSLVEEVQKTKLPCVIRVDGQDVAILSPARGGRTRARSKSMTADDPLSRLVGSVTDAAPSDSSQKDEYLAEAYARADS